MLGLLLPKSLLRVKSYQKLRDFLLTNFEIKCGIDVGQAFDVVRGEQVIFIAQKKKPTNTYFLDGNWHINSLKPSLTKISFTVPSEVEGT